MLLISQLQKFTIFEIAIPTYTQIRKRSGSDTKKVANESRSSK